MEACQSGVNFDAKYGKFNKIDMKPKTDLSQIWQIEKVTPKQNCDVLSSLDRYEVYELSIWQGQRFGSGRLMGKVWVNRLNV